MVTRQIHTECTRQNVGDASEEGAIKWDRGLRTSRQRERPHKAHALHPHPRLPPRHCCTGPDWIGLAVGFNQQPAYGTLEALPSDLPQLYLQDSPAKLSHSFGERGHHPPQKGMDLSNGADPPPVKDCGKDFAGAAKRKKWGEKKGKRGKKGARK